MSESRRRFGDVVVSRGLATPDEVVAALRVQGERAVAGRHQNLGEILVENGVLTGSQVRDLLGAQDRSIMYCPACGERYNVEGEAARTGAVCPNDGETLSGAARGAAVGVSATLKADSGSLVGRELGGCRLIELLGRGAMGAVYKARHAALDRLVAVKVIPSVQPDSAHVRRLLFEARTIAKLEHPNIVQVHDVGLQEGVFYMVMRLVPGRSLDARLAEEGRPSLPEALEITRDVARGLQAAHLEGVVHRDVKPGNVLVTPDGRACLTDFGLARAETAPDELRGMVVGTPCYMSPEQWLGETVDGRSDLYSLGILCYQLVTGVKPFEGSSIDELKRLHTEGKAKAPRSVSPDVSQGVQAVLGKLMARSPAKRYADAASLLGDLDRLIRGDDPKALEETGRRVRCGFCESLNAPQATKCAVCGEPVGASVVRLDVALRADETTCPHCRSAVGKGTRACTTCGRAV